MKKVDVKLGNNESATTIEKVCNTLNCIAKRKCGFKFHVDSTFFKISIFRCRNSYASFSTNLTIDEVTQQNASEIIALNAFFRLSSFQFSFNKDTRVLTITLLDEISSTNEEKLKNPTTFNENSFFITMLPLRKPFYGLSEILELFNSVGIKKMLSIHNNILCISAIGKYTSFVLKLKVKGNESELAEKFSKFNFIISSGLSDLRLSLKKFGGSYPNLIILEIPFPKTQSAIESLEKSIENFELLFNIEH